MLNVRLRIENRMLDIPRINASQWLHSTVTRGAPLSATPKSWRQIASTSVRFRSLDPHDHQRAFGQSLRQYLRSQTIRNTRLYMHGFQFSCWLLLPNGSTHPRGHLD